MAVEAGIGGDAIRFAAARWNEEQVAIGAGGFGPIRHRGEANFLAVGRKSEIIGIAALVGRHIVIGMRGHVARRAAICGDEEQVAALAVTPMHPVPIEQMIVYTGFHLAFFRGFVARAVARIVSAIREHTGSERDPSPVRGPFFIIRAGGERSDFFCGASLRGHYIHLGRTFAAGKKCDGFSIGRPLRARVMPRLRQLARLASRRGRDDPDIVRDAVGVHVGRAHGVGNGASVRRNLRFGDALHGCEVIERHGVFGRSLRLCGRDEGDQEKSKSLGINLTCMGILSVAGCVRGNSRNVAPREHPRYYFSTYQSIFARDFKDGEESRIGVGIMRPGLHPAITPLPSAEFRPKTNLLRQAKASPRRRTSRHGVIWDASTATKRTASVANRFPAGSR